MNNRKIDKIISLSPLVVAVLVPVGRYIFGKVLKKKKEEKNKIGKK